MYEYHLSVSWVALHGLGFSGMNKWIDICRRFLIAILLGNQRGMENGLLHGQFFGLFVLEFCICVFLHDLLKFFNKILILHQMFDKMDN